MDHDEIDEADNEMLDRMFAHSFQRSPQEEADIVASPNNPENYKDGGLVIASGPVRKAAAHQGMSIDTTMGKFIYRRELNNWKATLEFATYLGYDLSSSNPWKTIGINPTGKDEPTKT